MAVALIYPEPEHGGARTKGISSLKNELEIANGYISQARSILKSAPDLSDSVLSGSWVLPLFNLSLCGYKNVLMPPLFFLISEAQRFDPPRIYIFASSEKFVGRYGYR